MNLQQNARRVLFLGSCVVGAGIIIGAAVFVDVVTHFMPRREP